MSQSPSEKHCCIFHEFQSAASKSPNKIAVIHALGGAQIALERQSISKYINDQNSNPDDYLSEFATSSQSFPMLEGDESFTFSNIAASVDSLTHILCNILNGGDDPNLMKPGGESHCDKSISVSVSIFSESSDQSLKQSMINPNTIMPKIIGLYMEPSVEYIISVLSILKCGEAFLPIDPFLPKEKIMTIVSSNLDLILSCNSFYDGRHSCQFDSSHWFLECISCSVLCISMKQILERSYNSSSEMIWTCESRKRGLFSYVIYTSGSTGKPKGVCGTEDGILNRFLWMQESYPLHGDELLLFKSATSFIDHLQEFLAALLTTCTLIIPPASMLKANLFYLLDFMQVYTIERMISVPSLMQILLPSLRDAANVCILSSLKLLVLSGEIFPLSLWNSLSKLLPDTTILNLYGSTEVSGDCTYFDCRRLPLILQTESLSSVPIGIPISKCDVLLITEPGIPDHGELFVGGICVCIGYLFNKTFSSLELVNFSKDSRYKTYLQEGKNEFYFKTGDFAKQLQSGDFVFMGRNDRTVKVNGQRIALEEIEYSLRQHPDVVDAAVIFCKRQEFSILKAYVVSKQKNLSTEELKSSIRSWMIDRLPSAMIPMHLFIVKSLPTTSAGKVDYVFLEDSSFYATHVHDEVQNIPNSGLLGAIKQVFCNVLMVENISNEDNFFMMGGDSISAAHAAHSLGIDMRLIYYFPCPSKLQIAILQKQEMSFADSQDDNLNMNVNANANVSMLGSFNVEPRVSNSCKPSRILSRVLEEMTEHAIISKRLKTNSALSGPMLKFSKKNNFLWNSKPSKKSCSISRCNNITCGGKYDTNDVCQQTWSVSFDCQKKTYMRELWNVHMGSCVDASPTIVFKNGDVFLFIGSHSHIFMCINADSGSVWWKTELEGRIECSAAVLSDFSQVIVGCYKGKIYFLDFLTGNICWEFQTFGQVHSTLFVSSTSGRVTSLSIKGSEFVTLWEHELKVPIFGSLSVSILHGMVICCLVDGHVVALHASSGSVHWMVDAGGPIFAGSCISRAFVSQVLICSRNGNIYSFGLESGSLLWEYNVGEPMTASAFVDENLELLPAPTSRNPPDRLVCVCTSSGTIHLLRIKTGCDESKEDMVGEFSRLGLGGEIFSSPVMICGRVFVGCRDDFVHCIALEI